LQKLKDTYGVDTDACLLNFRTYQDPSLLANSFLNNLTDLESAPQNEVRRVMEELRTITPATNISLLRRVGDSGIGGRRRKSHRRKSHRRKSHRRKSHRRKLRRRT